MDTDCFWQTCSVLSTVLLLLCVGSGGSMFFSEQLRKFWSQKRANTSSDGLFSLLYRAKVRTFAASLEAAEAVCKTTEDQSIQCTMDVKKLVWSGLVDMFACLFVCFSEQPSKVLEPEAR